MKDISTGMQEHHKSCDEQFAIAEDAAGRGDWAACEAAFARFRDGLERHFGTEEEIIFPAFEQRSGMFGGPTQVMRMEHTQMRGLIAQMDSALKARDADSFCGAADTQLVLMQQHNMKEENILYPMCDQTLGADTALLEEVARSLEATA
ncbi:MAG: hemerythrin domain-containing protein [Rhodocyclaceae bacterium]